MDYAGALNVASQADLPKPADRIPIRAFADEASARAALESEAIQAFLFSLKTIPDLWLLDERSHFALHPDPKPSHRNLIAGNFVTVGQLAELGESPSQLTSG